MLEIIWMGLGAFIAYAYWWNLKELEKEHEEEG